MPAGGSDLLDDEGVEAVFEMMHFRGQRSDVIIGLDVKAGLRDQGAGVEFGMHPVNAAAMLRIVGRQCARMGVEAFMSWQQRRMDVEQTIGVVRDKFLTEDAHKTRQHDEVGLPGVDLCHHLTIIDVAIRVVGRCDHRRIQAGLMRPLQTESLGAIAQDADDAPAPGGILAGVDQCLQIAALT